MPAGKSMMLDTLGHNESWKMHIGCRKAKRYYDPGEITSNQFNASNFPPMPAPNSIESWKSWQKIACLH